MVKRKDDSLQGPVAPLASPGLEVLLKDDQLLRQTSVLPDKRLLKASPEAVDADISSTFIGQQEIKLAELRRLYQVGLELIQKSTSADELVSAILDEYERRFLEIPQANLLDAPERQENVLTREKVRALLMFASEAALLKEHADMDDRLRRQQEELLLASRQLEQSNAQLRRINEHYLNMLSFVAHELRSPLISILGFAELLQDGFLGELNTEQQNAAQIITRVTRNLIDMTRNYLDLTKIETGELRLKRTRLDLNAQVIEPLLTEMRSQFLAKNLRLVAKAGSRATEVVLDADPALLKIVFTNLFSNAVKYGNVDSDIVYNIVDLEEGVLVSVHNLGAGVPPDKLDRIFEKFNQVTPPGLAAELPRGTGLGLFNTRSIVEAHGGNIWAESEFGKWFKISVLLPKGPELNQLDSNQA
jgi:signal transduction histidine kinase